MPPTTISRIADSLIRLEPHWNIPIHCSSDPPISIVCISDTHNLQPTIPLGDILIHAGDLTNKGTAKELQKQLDWLNAQSHHYKIVIGGNHDTCLDATMTQNISADEKSMIQNLDFGDLIYLCRNETLLTFENGRRLRIFGNPYSPACGRFGFGYPRSEDQWKDLIPDHTDILISHGPPALHLDRTNRGLQVGCAYHLRELHRAKPRINIFGHIHEARGVETVRWTNARMAYEEIKIGAEAWILLGTMILSILKQWLGLECRPATTKLVNAAVLNHKLGPSDDRAAIVIDI